MARKSNPICSKCGGPKHGLKKDNRRPGEFSAFCIPCSNERTKVANRRWRAIIDPATGLTLKQLDRKRRYEKLGKTYRTKEEVNRYRLSKKTVEVIAAKMQAEEFRQELRMLKAQEMMWLKHPERIRRMRAIKEKQRRNNKTNYYFSKILRARTYRVLHGLQKSAPTLKLLGCSIPTLRFHLESQFSHGMTWNNYGAHWEIDHIRPCASFDLRLPEHQRECFHYLNLQPLRVTDNRRKHAVWEGVRTRHAFKKSSTRVLIEGNACG